jgi:hypothetical protein
MLLRKAYRFRIYPDASQEELFRRTIGCCRLVYNLCLDQKILERERSKPRKLTQFDQIKELTGLKEQLEFLYDVPHHPLVQSAMDLHKAFANFFEGRAGFPTFRKKGQNDSFRYPDPKKFEKDRIFLPKAGWTRVVLHRPIVGKVKNVTVSTVAGKWFASVQTEHEAQIPVNRGPAGRDRPRERPGHRSLRRHGHRSAAHHFRRPLEPGERAAGGGPPAEGFAQPREGETQSGQVAGQIRPSQEGRGAQGDHDDRQEPRHRRRRGPEEGARHIRRATKCDIARSSAIQLAAS